MNILFCLTNNKGENVGELLENHLGELSFKGNVDESANIFFKEIIQKNNVWITKLKKGLQEIIDNSGDNEAKRISQNLISGNF